MASFVGVAGRGGVGGQSRGMAGGPMARRALVDAMGAASAAAASAASQPSRRVPTSGSSGM
eukprot:10233715-Alexandrium_andersonii.AAC.1